MAAPSKTKKIETLAKLLQKRHKGLPGPPERTVLEYLIYAALLENASYEQADSAMTVLEHHFIDWNEVRVSTIGELADVFSMLPDPKAAGERVRLALQGVFEKTYQFDLEDLRKKGKNLSQAVGFLESISACSRFMIDYASQVAFGGHVIPLDEASLRIFRLLGLTQVNKEGTKEEVSGLERAISKKNGPVFASQLHLFAAGFFADPESAELRALLKPIDPEALKRDWTPPALTVPKAPEKVVQKTVPPTTLPFVASDDDDFDDDQGGTEAEFISDGEDDTAEPPVHRGKDRLPAVASQDEPEKTKKTGKEKTEKKTAAPAPKPTSKKDAPEKETKKTVQKTEIKGGEKTKAVKKKTEPAKKPPGKTAAKQAPSAKSDEKKGASKKVTTKTAKKETDKSPTRQLREKKPK